MSYIYRSKKNDSYEYIGGKNMKKKIRKISRIILCLMMVAAILVLTPSAALAEDGDGGSLQLLASTTITADVTVIDSLGMPVEGEVFLDLRIYDEEFGGFLLWSEAQIAEAVGGLTSIVLGAAVPFPFDPFDGVTRYLGVSVNGENEGSRQILISAGVAEGADISIDLTIVKLTFDEVTEAGWASVTTSSIGPQPPGDTDLGSSPTYYNIRTTGTFIGEITVCIIYDPALYSNPKKLHLLHFNNNEWQDLNPLLFAEVTVTDAAGNPIEGEAELTLYIYTEEAGGTLLWQETQTVTVEGTTVSLYLGSIVPLPREIFDGATRFLSVSVDGGAELPRQTLVFDKKSMCGKVSSLSPFVIVEKIGPEVINVDLDLKPGSDTNNVNLGSKGTIPIAILSTVEFDANTVDPTTVTLAGATVGVRGKSDKLMASLEDVNGDDLDDLVIHIVNEMALTEGSTEVLLQGSTFDGTAIEGTDTVNIVPA
jgi:hypothetical protein